MINILIFNILFVNQYISNHLFFIFDIWTSSNMLSFLNITAHWITRDWELKEILLDFCILYRLHSGENLAEVFEHCCRELGILTKVCVTKFFVYIHLQILT